MRAEVKKEHGGGREEVRAHVQDSAKAPVVEVNAEGRMHLDMSGGNVWSRGLEVRSRIYNNY